ncbi:MAG: hypothetical protein NUV51_03860 [Sulfuricaulis sp.]|nr:hypothetical protein [Sulfuricaulis sp.]
MKKGMDKGKKHKAMKKIADALMRKPPMRKMQPMQPAEMMMPGMMGRPKGM